MYFLAPTIHNSIFSHIFVTLNIYLEKNDAILRLM